jgi:hypothetical protein
MVTSALSKQNLRFPSQGSDRQLPGVSSISEGVSVQAKADVRTSPGTRSTRVLPDGRIVYSYCLTHYDGQITRVQRFDQLGVEDRWRQVAVPGTPGDLWRVRRERGFAGMRIQFSVSREMPLREQIREWEQDEQRKMEQERQSLRGARRNLDHLKRRDLRSSDEEMDQSSESEDSDSNAQNFLNNERCANRQNEEDWWIHRLSLGGQKDKLMGEDTHDRAWDESRSPLGTDHQ